MVMMASSRLISIGLTDGVVAVLIGGLDFDSGMVNAVFS